MSSTAREVRAGIAANGGEAASLVESATLLRWRAPELALLLADRAVSAAQDDPMAVLRADHLAVFTLNRLGRHAEAAHRLFPAIHDPDTPAGLKHELHVELAHCAAALEEPVIALGAVHPVLAAGDDVAPALRAGALVAVAAAAAALGCDDLATSALEEADELYREDSSLDHDTALLLRASARATDAARLRARGTTDRAEVEARAGRELLAGLADPDHDSGEVSARLMLELALLLLDRGAGEQAMHEVRPLLRRPVRAAAAATVGRLRLAVATRVHLAEGRHEPALTLLADAVEGAQRYGMDAVLAECLEGLSHVHEARDEFADALHCMRAARAAEARHLHELAAARSTLREHCGSVRREEARLAGEVAALLGNAGAGGAGLDAEAGSLTGEITPESSAPRLAAIEAPDAQVAELADQKTPETDIAEPEIAEDVVQDITESLGPGELESWQSRARHRRGSVGTVVSVSDLVPASALSHGRSGRRRAEELAADRADGGPVGVTPEAGDDGAGAEEGVGDPQPAADGSESPPVSAAASPAPVGSSPDAPDTVSRDANATMPEADAQNVLAPRREFPASAPPPAPTLRTLEWEPAEGKSPEDGETHRMGLGDLLAEALAAYQESRDVPSDALPTGAAADADTSQTLPRYRGLGTRGMAGLSVAPKPSDPDWSEPESSDPDSGDADPAEASEAITNPLLRLPELTTEPRWAPPETGRRPAAGD